MSDLARRLDQWAAPPAPPERLAAFRILLGAFTLLYLLVRLPVFLSLADGRPGRFEPVGVLSTLPAPLPSALIMAVTVSAILASAAFIAGYRYRLSGPVLATTMLLLGTYRSSWGQILHFETLLVLHLLIIGLSPAAEAWSVDAHRNSRERESSSRYGWPLRLAAIVTAVTYVLAGLAKLRYGGLEWMFGDTLQNHVAYTATRLALLGGDPSPLAGRLVGVGWLFPPVATATVMIELAAPVALVSRRWRLPWAVSAWLMHVGILGLMFIVFPYPLVGLAFAPLFELERLSPALRRTWRPRRHRSDALRL